MLIAILSILIGLILTTLLQIGLWLHEVKSTHLPHVLAVTEESRDAVLAVPAALKEQTTAIVGELREQRQDIRSLTAAKL